MKAITFLCALVAIASAQEQESSPWSVELSLGGLFTSGNTELAQVDAELEVSRTLTSPEFTVNLLAATSYGSQSGVNYIERYMTLLNLKYEISEKLYASADGRWYSNEFIGISNEYRTSMGMGYRILHGETFGISVDAGAGLYNRENTAGDRLETSIGYVGLRSQLALSDSWTISEVAFITADLQDLENFYLESYFEAESSILQNLSFVLGYNVVYFTVPPIEGLKETDTTLRLLLRFTL